MADVNANIGINIDTSQSLAEIKNLQRQLAQLYTSINKGSAAAAAAQKGLATNLMNTINAGGKFYAQMGTIRTSTESFTHALEKNKLTMREYFRFAGGSTRTFGKLFKSEFDTIGKVAEERVKKMQTQYIKLGRDASGAMKAISITPTTLNMKDYGNQVAVAAQKQALLNQLLKQGSTNLLNFGKNTQWAGRQLMVGFTIPLAYFGTAAAKTFMDLEAQALKFRRVYGDMFTTTAETEKALDNIRALAEEFTKYGVAVTKTMEMAAAAAAMGKTGADLTAQVAEATRLSVLGNVEQQQALDTTISLTNAFGLAAEDLASKINFLNAVENQTVTAIEDLTIAIPKAGPVVQQLGGSVEDLAFFLTAMREGGINASEGANALKSGLASLINPTDKAAKMLLDMGINIKEIVEGNVGNLRQTVIDFALALDTLAPLERSRAIEQLFGKFQFARLSTLFQNVTKDGNQAARVLQLAGASVEELAILSERELKAVEDAIGTNFRAAVEELKVAIAPIGKEFLKVITPIVEFLGRLLDRFNNLGDGTKKFIVIFSTLVGLIGPTLLMTFGLVANGAANIIKLFILMRQGFLKLSGNTTNLAAQTQYLNQEQMEAAVVAASLNQAHTKLTQQFTLEAAAVNQLRNAYVSATVAATNFAARNPGMMGPSYRGIKGGGIPRMASGTTEVVGGQAGKDSVPALLMPGEAVVPTAIAQDDRFKPLINALVSGEIAKYKKGTVAAGDDYAHVGGGKLTNLDKIIATGGLTQNELRQAEIYRDILKATGKAGEARAYGSLAYSFDANMNKQMANVGVPLAAFEKAWLDRPNKWTASGLTASESRTVDQAILRQIKMSGVTKVTDTVVENAFKNLPPDIKANPAYQKMASLQDRIGSYSLGKGLGSTPQSSAQILEQAKKSGVIKDFRVETRVGKNGQTKTRSLIVVTNDGKEVNLGRGSRANRVYFADGSLSKSQKAAVASVAAAKGEFYQTKDGKIGVVGGQTGKPKPSGRNVTASPRDTRVMATQNLARIFPYGIKGPRYSGAIDGQDFTGGAVGPRGLEERRRSQADDLAKAIKDNTKSQDQGTDTQEKTAKELKRDQRSAKMQRMSNIGGPVAMAAGTAGMVAAMSGAPQIMTNFLFGLSAVAGLLPLLANPLGIAVAGIAALGIAIYKFNSDLKKAREEGANFAKSMTMTNQKLVELSKITGTVSATELAKRQRQTILTGASGVQRKTGQTILESQFGQGVMKDIETQQKAGASNDQIAKSLGLGLSTAIMQGVLTTEQAKSFAAALGEKLGNYDIPLDVSATIVSLVGPNGERLEREPLQVALEIKKQSMEQQAQVFQNAISQRRPEVSNLNKAVIAGSVAAGFLAPGPGTIAATVGLGKVYFDIQKTKAANLKLDTAAIQLGFEAVSQGQGLIDSLNRQYDNKIKQAKTDAEINELEKQRKAAIDRVNQENAKTLDILIKQKDQFSPGAFDAAIKAAADTMYKEGPMAVFKDQAIDALKTLGEGGFKTTLQLGFVSGDIDPNQIIALVEMAKNDKDLQANFDFIVNTYGMAEAGVLIGLLERSGANQQTYKIITQFIEDNPEQFKDTRDALAALSNIAAKYGVTVDINTVGLKQLQQIDRVTDTLKKEKGPITQEIIAKYAKDPNNPDQSIYQGILDTWETLVGSSTTITKEMVIDFSATYSDPNVKNFFDASKGLTNVPQHLKDLMGSNASAASAYLIGTGEGAQGETKGTGKGKGKGTTGERDTTLDELLKRLKFIRQASIDAQGGINELMKITSGKGIKAFGGVMQQLMQGPKGGFNREFIAFLESMDNKTRKMYMTVQNGQVVLTKQGRALKEAFNEKVVGEYQVAQRQALQDTKAQGAALIKLERAGVDTATALEMVSDANLAVAINSKDISSKELQNMATNAQKAKDAVEQLNLALKQASIDATEKLADSKTTLDVLTKIRQLQPNVSQEIMDYIASNPAFAKSLADAFKGATNNLKEMQNILDSIPEQKRIDIEVALQVNPVAELERQLGTVGDRLSQYFQGQRTLISQPFMDQISVIDEQIAGYNLQSIPLEINLNQAQASLRVFENNISAIEAQISQMRLDIETGIDQEIKAQSKIVENIRKQIEDRFDKQIESLQESVRKRQRDIELTFDRPIEALQEQSSDLSNELTLMDRQIDGINERYDAQANALTKINEINADIANQQRQQLDLADALTQGDISAAARAAEEMRQSAAEAASNRTRDALDVAKQAEIDALRSQSGLTRAQIEEKQFQISQQIFALEEQREAVMLQIRVTEDEIYKLQEARAEMVRTLLVPAEEKLAQLEEKRALALEAIAAKELEILRIKQDPAYKQALKDVADAEKALANLQQQIRDAELARSKIQAEMELALNKLNKEEKTWEDIKKSIDIAKGSVVDYGKEIDKARGLANKLRNSIIGVLNADAGFNIPGVNDAAAGIPGAEVDNDLLTTASQKAARGEMLNDAEAEALGMMPGSRAATPTATPTSGSGGNRLSLTKQLADSTKEVSNSVTLIKDLEIKIEELKSKTLTHSKDIKDVENDIYELEVKRVLEVEKIKSYIQDILPILMQENILIKDILEGLKLVNATLPESASLWNKIKDALLSAASSISTYVASLETALEVAKQLFQTIMSLNTTVVTTHIVHTIYTSSGGPGGGPGAPGAPGGPGGDTGSPGGSTGGIGSGIGDIAFMYGGKVKPMSIGGRVGSDYIPALLTPGEFVVNRGATKQFGPLLNAINSSKYPSMIDFGGLNEPQYNFNDGNIAVPVQNSSTSINNNNSAVYNYSIGINVSEPKASANDIARSVITQIQYLDNQRIRGQR